MLSLKEEIEQLKKEKNAVILAHYYVPDDVQEVADYIGDLFYLSKIAKNIGADLIVFAGVSFMGESAKILNPKRKYYCQIDMQIVQWHIWQVLLK